MLKVLDIGDTLELKVNQQGFLDEFSHQLFRVSIIGISSRHDGSENLFWFEPSWVRSSDQIGSWQLSKKLIIDNNININKTHLGKAITYLVDYELKRYSTYG